MTRTSPTSHDFSYRPDDGFTGTDSFTYSIYTLVGGASNEATVTIEVSAPLTISTEVSSDEVRVGESVTDTATLTPRQPGPPPTGSVLFYLYGPDDPNCEKTPVSFSAGSLDIAGIAASDPFFPQQPGTYRWMATYPGDGTYPAVSEPCNAPNESFVVTAGPDPLPLMANDDAYTVPKGQGTLLQPDVTGNDDGDFTGVEVVTEPTHGALTRTDELAHDFTYIPETDFVGTDSFQYRLLGANAGLAAAAATAAADSCDVATVTITVADGVAAPFATTAADEGCGGGGGEEDVVDVGADCSGDVTFTNLLDEQINVRYGPGDTLEGEFDLAAGQSETITTSAQVLTFLAANATHGESGSIEIPDCSNGGGNDDDDSDDGDDGDHDGKRHHSHLPDTGSPFASTSLLAAWLLTAIGSYLIVRSRRRVI